MAAGGEADQTVAGKGDTVERIFFNEQGGQVKVTQY